MIQLTSDNLLPDPSILKKLEVAVPGSAEAAFNRAQRIAHNRRQWESDNLRTFRLTEEFRLRSKEGIGGDWARTGDNMRLGILAVMHEHKLGPQDIHLTEQEQQSLTLIRTSIPDALEKFDF